MGETGIVLSSRLASIGRHLDQDLTDLCLRTDRARQGYAAECTRYPQIDPLCVDPENQDVICAVDAIHNRQAPAQNIRMVLAYVRQDPFL